MCVERAARRRARVLVYCIQFTPRRGRTWWDGTFHDLHIAIRPNDGSIAGYNGIPHKMLEPATEMQIDLMEPLRGAKGGGRDEPSVIDQSA